MENILDVTQRVVIDNTIVDMQFHSYQAYIASQFNYNDEIRIPIQELDTYTLPCESYLYIEGKLTKDDGTPATVLKFINNAISFLFREIRYELNGVTVDLSRNVGLTSTLKGYLSYNSNESVKLQNAGWFPNGKSLELDKEGNFNVCLPLKMVMGFFEDYRKIMLNMKQELVLIRNNNDVDAVIGENDTEKPKVAIEKVVWRMPHVSVGLSEQLSLTKLINKNIDILLPFRSWELVEYPTLNETKSHTWPVKTTTKLETPRHAIFALQTDRKGKILKDMSQFDHCDLYNIRLFLNSERYPYNDLYLNFNQNKFASLYEMFADFRKSYYGTSNEPIFSPADYLSKAPITHLDCSHQKDAIQTGSVVLRLEFETNTNIPKNTSAYCLILHDKIFSYNPLTKIVKQL